MKAPSFLAAVAAVLFHSAGACLAADALADGLVAYYPFTGNANDASGNGRHLSRQAGGPPEVLEMVCEAAFDALHHREHGIQLGYVHDDSMRGRAVPGGRVFSGDSNACSLESVVKTDHALPEKLSARCARPELPPPAMPLPDDGDPGNPPPTDTAALFELTYAELRRVAQSLLSSENHPQTLQATALVHEAYLRLSSTRNKPWANDRHFFVAAAEAMRRILIDSARKRLSQKRGGGLRRTEFPADGDIPIAEPDLMLQLNAALQDFERFDPEKAELVKLRFYGGLTMEQISPLLDISLATAKRHWAYARAWLQERINSDSASDEPSHG